MKKLLKWLLISIIILLVGLYIATKVMSKEIPSSIPGPEAEALTDKILERINKPAWDSLQYVSWTFFRGQHHYIWNKTTNTALIKWDDYSVLMPLDDQENTIIKKGNLLITDKETHQSIRHKAWTFWCNDSFWLYAPYKLRDKGIKRSLVEKEGKQGLLLTYESGGTTPGDSYLWWVDETGLPLSFDMWTSIIPIKGLNASWNDWEVLPGGAMVATSHKLGPVEMSLSNLKASDTLANVGGKTEEFNQGQLGLEK